MEDKPFQNRDASVVGNERLRTPQKEAFEAMLSFAEEETEDREVGIVLPVGCGKTGCITLAPFAFRAKRVLVVAPNVQIAGQLHGDFDPLRLPADRERLLGAELFLVRIVLSASVNLSCPEGSWRWRGSEHPDSDFCSHTQQRRASVKRKKIGKCSFQLNRRRNIRLFKG